MIGHGTVVLGKLLGGVNSPIKGGWCDWCSNGLWMQWLLKVGSCLSF